MKTSPSTPISLVQFVTVESPCRLAERGAGGGEWGRHEHERFCTHCNLHVHNLSARTTAEADNLIATYAGTRLCVRYQHDDAGRPLTIERLPANRRFTRFLAPIARPVARIAAFIGLATLAAAIGGLTGCSAGANSLGGKRADPSAKTAPALPDSRIATNVPPNNLMPIGAISGSLGLGAITEADFADAVRKQQQAKPHIWTAPDE